MQYTSAILTGGKSSRMGGIKKYLLKINDTPIIERQINTLKSLFDDIIIIGDTELDNVNIKSFSDIYKDCGPLGGIHSALHNSKSNYTFITSADMPFISEKLIAEMSEILHANNYDAIIPKHQNGIEPLFGFYSKSIIKLIEKMLTNKNFKIRNLYNLINIYYFDVSLQYNSNIIFTNINYNKDFIKALNYANRFKT